LKVKHRSVVYAGLLIGLLSGNVGAAPFSAPDPATLHKLSRMIGKAAPARQLSSNNRFAALQPLAANTTGACAANLAATGNGRKLWAIYIVGADLEGDGGFATANLKQLVEGWNALSDKDNVDVVIAFGGATKDGWHGIKYADMAQVVADMADGAMGNADNYLYRDDTADMGQQATFEAFLNYVNGKYAQDSRKFLSFWNHGSSYTTTPGIGPDQNSNTVLDLAKINNGLAGTQSCYHLIGFDACLMASMETAVAIKDFGRYMVASEELEPGHGWNYAHVLNALAAQPGNAEVGKAMVDSFVNSASHASVQDGKTLSVLDLGQVDAAVQALEAASSALAAGAVGSEMPNVIRAFYTTQKYAGSLTVDPDVVPSQLSIDLKDFLSVVAVRSQDGGLKQQIGAATGAIDKLVVYSRDDGTRARSNGVAIAPLDMNAARAAEQVGVGLINHGWGQLIKSYATLKKSASAPSVGALQVGVVGAGVSYVSARDGSRDSDASAANVNSLGMTARFASPYLAEARGSYGLIDKDGGLILLGENPSYLTGDGSYYMEQWNGQGLMLGNAQAFMPIPVFITQVANSGVSYNSIAVIERPGLAAPLLGMVGIAPDAAGNLTYSINPIESHGDNYLISREDLQIQAKDTVTFYTTKLLPKGGSEVVPLARHTFNETPGIFQTAMTNGDYGYALVGYSVGDLAGLAAIQALSSAERVLNWGAATNPTLQLSTDTLYLGGYTARCNSGKTLCVGAKDNALWYYDGAAPGNLGGLDGWLEQAGNAGY